MTFTSHRQDTLSNITMFIALILSGGSLYNLSYLRGSFESTMLSSFALNDTELGQISALLGLASLLCYFPGGWLADRFNSRVLLTLSCLFTGLGGLYMSTLTGAEASTYDQMIGLHLFWAVTSILTYWAALIKATQDWGGDNQGVAFGLLDSGRGLVKVLLSTLAIWLFSRAPNESEGLTSVIYVHSAACFASAVACWLFVKTHETPEDDLEEMERVEDELGVTHAPHEQSALLDLIVLFKLPAVWLMGGVVFAAYSAYWSTFTFARYAQEAYGLKSDSAAYMSTISMWVRALMPLAAGVLADRIGKLKVVSYSFVACALCFAVFALTQGGSALTWLLFMNVVLLAIGIFSLRGVYFALMKDTHIPHHLTGLAVGVISLIGFTPDIIVPLFKSALVEHFTSAEGVLDVSYHQYFYGALGCVSVLGLIAALKLPQGSSQTPPQDTPQEFETSLS